jgi:hypothetical protein
MALYAWAAFNEFLAKLEPTGTQKATIETKRNATHNYLLEGFDSSTDMPLLRTVLIGSASRETIIRPIEDVDVMAVFSDENDVWEEKYKTDSHSFIQRIRNVLDHDCTTTVGTRGQAVRLFYKAKPHVDIAPVFMAGDGGYWLPKGDGNWMKTDPDVQATWFSQENIRLSGHLRPLVRLLKRWNNEHSNHFKSYHLEVVTANIFASLGSNYREAVAKFFLWAPNWIDVDDPAGYSGSLSSYLTFTQRQLLLQRLSNAADRAALALEAEDSGDHEEAIRLWRIEIGGEFPTYC